MSKKSIKFKERLKGFIDSLSKTPQIIKEYADYIEEYNAITEAKKDFKLE